MSVELLEATDTLAAAPEVITSPDEAFEALVAEIDSAFTAGDEELISAATDGKHIQSTYDSGKIRM